MVIINEASTSKIKFVMRVGTFYRENVTPLRRVSTEAPRPEVKANLENWFISYTGILILSLLSNEFCISELVASSYTCIN